MEYKITTITKRDGSTVPFDDRKIFGAIFAANLSCCKKIGKIEEMDATDMDFLTAKVVKCAEEENVSSVEGIQDIVERMLIRYNYPITAKEYILYRAERTKIRDGSDYLMETFKKLTFTKSTEVDSKRENANIDGDSSMGVMLKYGSESSKYFINKYVLPPHIAKAHEEGYCHLHDADFYMLNETCCQIDIKKLFETGFTSGHGFLRPPQSIESYAALACIVIQSNQNEMHGGQSIPNFDWGMEEGVKKTYAKEYRRAFETYLEVNGFSKEDIDYAWNCYYSSHRPELEFANEKWTFICDDKNMIIKRDETGNHFTEKGIKVEEALEYAKEKAEYYTDKRCYQAMEAFIHNLCTMSSRAGAQVPFSSVNYGTCTSPEGRMVIKNILLATEAGLGNGETAIFPVQVFQLMSGINYNPEDPNYDLFQLSMRVSAKRLFPNYLSLDTPFNKQYIKEGDPNTYVATMGCRTRVMGNVHDPEREVTCGRGNLSFTTINLPRLGIEADHDIDKFFELYDNMIDLVFEQLLHRFKIQSNRKVYNYPFLMGNGIWLDSEKLEWTDTIGEVLKHGTLTVGFCGLAECLVALIGKHHGESEEAQELGLRIVKHMRDRCDQKSQELKLNFTCIATPAESTAGRFAKLDRKKYGIIPGVTEREYYTNSNHVPVYYPISASKKIDIEAPYHQYCNAGAILYVEMQGDTAKNLEAFERIVRYMHDKNAGYFSINHPVDRDPVCGYVGVIDDICPRCGRREGEPISEEKLQELKRKYPNVPFHGCDCNH